ncbi:hypothetical protein PENTCL1PPCAC_2749, partial [Pristionchus entomophagus]
DMLEKYRTEVLKLISDAGIELAASEQQEFKKIGAGCISSIFQVKLKNNSTILCKLTEIDEARVCSELHNREIEFYQWLSIDEELKRHLKCPKYYGGYPCKEEIGIILMEDLSTRICNDMNWITGLPVDCVAKVVKELAAVQCAHLSSSNAELLSNRLDRVDFSAGVRNVQLKVDTVTGLSAAMQIKLLEWVEPVTLFKIQTDVPNDVEGISPSLVHCDLWPGNFLFCRNAAEVDLLSIIDWQCFKIGNPLLDVASILGVCMTPEDRREHTNTVLKVYVNEIEKRKSRFTKPFDMTIEKAQQLLSHALSWPCVQIMFSIAMFDDEEHDEEYEVLTARLPEMMKDAMNL